MGWLLSAVMPALVAGIHVLALTTY
jgi:hypothetical protein